MSAYSDESLIRLIDDYVPPPTAKEAVDSAPPTLLVGISGAGKDTTKAGLLKTGEFSEIVSHTTRPPRINNGELERDGREYHFVGHEAVFTMAQSREFIELKRVHGNSQEVGDIYGTSLAELEKARTAGKIAVTDLDVQGVREYKRISEKTIAIFILPPDYETWIERLSKRYDTKRAFENEWPKRSRSAIIELETALSLPYYHFIINDDITRTVTVASEIARRGDVFKRGDDEARLAARDLLGSIRSRIT